MTETDVVERIEHGGRLVAVIVRSGFDEPGIHFFTPNDLSQQLAHMRHPAGHVIEPHHHNRITREVHYTQEALFVRSGCLRVDLYDDAQTYLESRILRGGDTILLCSGGHGFTVLEETRMIEVKQGPFAGAADKTRFDPVAASRIALPDTDAQH